jgi:TonB family protein
MSTYLRATLLASCLLAAVFAQAEDRPIVRRVQPSYPEIAKRMHVTGVVEVQVTVNPDGKVQEAKALNGHPMLKDAAANAAKSYVYEPGATSTEKIDFKFMLNQ